MRRNREGEVFWTGLVFGKRHCDVCAKGRDFIMFIIGETLCGFPEVNKKETKAFIKVHQPGEWVRIRAMSFEQAHKRYDDAFTQWRCYGNTVASGVAVLQESIICNIVRIPFEDRPEYLTNKDLLKG